MRFIMLITTFRNVNSNKEASSFPSKEVPVVSTDQPESSTQKKKKAETTEEFHKVSSSDLESRHRSHSSYENSHITTTGSNSSRHKSFNQSHPSSHHKSISKSSSQYSNVSHNHSTSYERQKSKNA